MNSKWTLQLFHRRISCNLFWIIAVLSHVSVELTRAQNTCNSSRACFPEIVDLLHNLGSFPDRSVSATSSCNESSPSGGQYNSLVASDTTVYTCASDSVQPGNMVDQEAGSAPTYWQSENMIDTEGAEPKVQYLVFNFTDQFLIHTILIKFMALHVSDDQISVDARPVAWSIEKWNVTLGEWATLRHFALDCQASFPGVAIYDPFSTSLEYLILFCEQYNPVFVGEPFFDADNFIEFYPGILDTHDNLYKDNPEATEIFSTSAIRFVIKSPPSARPRKSYVAISDVIIDGQCKCYGHGAVCSGPNEATCECEHNTQGSECRSCLPLYNNDQWKPGTSTAANICVECACNGHASSCVYDEVKASGVCVDCVNNTAGDTCSSCVSGFYINPNHSGAAAGAAGGAADGAGGAAGGAADVGGGTGGGVASTTGEDEKYCLACACDTRGTESASLTTCNATSGQCLCKERVTGRACGECMDTNWGLAEDKALGCDVCDCVAGGSVSGTNMCDKVTGECSCKVNVEGVRCDTCKTFTFNFDPANSDGCTACDCDAGASLDASCDVTSGACSCLPNIGGRDCRTPTAGFFVPKMDIMVLEPEEFIAEGVTLRPGHGTVGATVSGRGFVTLSPGSPIEMTFESVYSGLSDVVLRLERISTEDLFVFVQGMITLSSADNSCNGETIPSGQVWNLAYSSQLAEIRGGVVIGQICASSGSSYAVILTSPAGSPLMVDSLVFIPDLTSVTTQLSPRLPPENITSCRDATVKDVRANRQSCSGVEYSVMSALLGGAMECSCLSGALTSSGCDDHSGDCMCLPGALGPQCLRCELDAHGFTETSGCQACGCEVTGSSSVSCSDAGVCQCLVNVVGDKCDACMSDHYGLSTGEGCRPCECNLNYSTSNSCDDAGVCPCQPGVGGQLCDQCLDGHYALSAQGCTECACNTYGSTGRSCDVINGTCECLPRVEGNTCSDCKPGFYALGEWHPSGCLECFCWGQGQTCSSAPSWYDAPTQITWLTEQAALTDILVARDDLGAAVTVDTPTVATPTGQQYAMSMQAAVTSAPSRDIFFIGPQQFLGDRTSSFGRSLTLVVRPVTLTAGAAGGTSDSASNGDVILRGGYSNLILGFQFSQNFTANEITTIQVPIIEGSWRILSPAEATEEGSNTTDRVKFTSLTPPTHSQLMEVLARVMALEIRGYRSDGLRPVLDLVRVQLDGAIDGEETLVHSEVPVNNVGQCACAEGYTGRLCESCAAGWTRADPSTPDPNTECVPCACNSHGVVVNQCDDVTGVCTHLSGPCDPVTGVCTCQHNTGGDHCELCLPGYYGDPTRGTSEDCLQCACPGIVVLNEVNVFAQTCSQNGTGHVMCAGCQTGYEGDRCENCVQGYFGTPENVTNNNGSCSLCACNERADTCDSRTGVCAACRNNTAGDNCQLCAPGYFGDPQVAPCQECNCDLPGSTGSCDHSTGECECLQNVSGSSCDVCVDTTFNLQAGQGCEPCRCHANGSTSAICDKDSGQCPCRPLVQGQRCDECTANFWNINTATGCNPCECNADGTIKENDVLVETCDVNTGQCTCALPGIVGRTCDRCSPVSKLVLQYVSLIFLGEFPNCQVCGQCFDDWALVLEGIGEDFHESQLVLDGVWSKYDGQSASEVTPLLDTVEEKIAETSESITTFQVVATQLSELQAQFTQASSRQSTASAQVGILADTERTLVVNVDTLAALTDQIQVTVTAVSSIAAIQAELDDLAREAQATAVAGNTTWEDIQTLSFVAVSPEDREKEFKQQAQRYTQIASIANESFALISSLYDATLAPGVAENEQELQTASETASGATSSLAEVSSILENIASDMTNIQASLTSMEESSQTAKARLSEAVNSLQDHVINASSALRTAEQVTSAALSFKAAAEAEEASIVLSMTSVLENIASLSQAQSDLVEAQVLAARVKATRLPSQADMQVVVDDVAASGVSAEDVAELNLKSQADLYVAEEAIADTQTALRLAKELTEDVQLMQSDIDQSRELRSQAEEQRVVADSLHDNVLAVLEQASSQNSQTDSNMESITERANELLAIVSNATSCFRDQEVEVGTAVTSARQAETRAESASEAQRNLLATMNSINSEADEGDLVDALTTMTQADNVMQETAEDLEALVAFAKIEDLIQQLLNQNQELRNLDLEVDQLTSELDTLALALQESAVTTTCNEQSPPP